MKSRNLTYSATIAALYVVLTLFSQLLGLSCGGVQLRLSEALAILPCFTASAVPGLFIGCLLSGSLTGLPLIDIIFGSIATLLGAIFTGKLKKYPLLAALSPVVTNTLILPWVMIFAYAFPGTFWYFAATTALSEFLSCFLLGLLLYSIFKKYPVFK